jgi:preprotein translocase subunit YajC
MLTRLATLLAALTLFAGEAFAMAPPAGGQGGTQGFITSILPLVVIFAIFYFLIIMPQQKKAKAHKKMIEDLKRGDKVVTTGGIYGVVEQVGGETVTLKIAEGTKVKFGKSYISTVRSASDED